MVDTHTGNATKLIQYNRGLSLANRNKVRQDPRLLGVPQRTRCRCCNALPARLGFYTFLSATKTKQSRSRTTSTLQPNTLVKHQLNPQALPAYNRLPLPHFTTSSPSSSTSKNSFTNLAKRCAY